MVNLFYLKKKKKNQHRNQGKTLKQLEMVLFHEQKHRKKNLQN